MRQGRRDILLRIESICLLPRFEGVTPAVAIGRVANPSSMSTVKVEILVGSVDESETLFNDRCDLVERSPDPEREFIESNVYIYSYSLDDSVVG